jgi:hypothetical protein
MDNDKAADIAALVRNPSLGIHAKSSVVSAPEGAEYIRTSWLVVKADNMETLQYVIRIIQAMIAA